MMGSMGLALGLSGRANDRAYFALPDETGVEAIHLFDEGLEKARLNMARGKPSALIVGAPAVGSGFLSFGSAAYLQTVIGETVDQTLMVVARTSDTLASDARRPGFLGNYRAPWTVNGSLLSAGVGLVMASATQTTAYVGRSSDGATVANQVCNAAIVATGWQILVARATAGGSGIWSLTTNVRTDTTGNSPRALNTAAHRFGCGVDRYLGNCDEAGGIIASAAWSDAAVVANAKRMAAYLEPRLGVLGLVNAAL